MTQRVDVVVTAKIIYDHLRSSACIGGYGVLLLLVWRANRDEHVHTAPHGELPGVIHAVGDDLSQPPLV